MSVLASLGAMSLRQLEVFYAVVAAGSITAAAESLHISQPTVSATIRRMEDQLGLALFRKDRGRLAPTNEGRLLFEALQRNFRYFQAIADAISMIQKGVSQRMSIAAIQPLGNGIVSAALQQFLKERLEARVHLLIRPRKAVYHAVAAEGADLGISFSTGEAEQEGLSVEKVCSGRLFCIMPNGHPLESRTSVTHDDLVDYPLVSFPPGHQWLLAQFEKVIDTSKQRPEPVLTVDSVMSIYPHVENGIGLGLVDEFSLRSHSKERLSYRPFEPTIGVAIELVYPNRRASDLTKAFVKHFKAACSHIHREPL
jgi:DNA-binding transcriptional LysR family regulator